MWSKWGSCTKLGYLASENLTCPKMLWSKINGSCFSLWGRRAGYPTRWSWGCSGWNLSWGRSLYLQNRPSLFAWWRPSTCLRPRRSCWTARYWRQAVQICLSAADCKLMSSCRQYGLEFSAAWLHNSLKNRLRRSLPSVITGWALLCRLLQAPVSEYRFLASLFMAEPARSSFCPGGRGKFCSPTLLRGSVLPPAGGIRTSLFSRS